MTAKTWIWGRIWEEQASASNWLRKLRVHTFFFWLNNHERFQKEVWQMKKPRRSIHARSVHQFRKLWFFFFHFSDTQSAWLIWKLPELEAAGLRLQQGISLQSFPYHSDQSQANFVINLQLDWSKKQINTWNPLTPSTIFQQATNQ